MLCSMRIDTEFIESMRASRNREGPKYLPPKFSGRQTRSSDAW